jgi:hypothetical protein
MGFDSSHPNKSEVVFHCGLICCFLMVCEVGHLFKCLLAICVFSLEKCLDYFYIQFLYIDKYLDKYIVLIVGFSRQTITSSVNTDFFLSNLNAF